MQWQDYIISDPKVHNGAPCIKGAGILVEMIIGSLQDGLPADRLELIYGVEAAAVEAVQAYAAEQGIALE